MKDLEIAESLLKKENLNLVLVKNEQILFKSRSPGIKGPLKAVRELKGKITPSSAADRIIGRAVALLLAHLGVTRIFGETVSKEGKHVLERNDIYLRSKKIVPRITDEKAEKVCPFERLVNDIDEPEKAYLKIESEAADLID